MRSCACVAADLIRPTDRRASRVGGRVGGRVGAGYCAQSNNQPAQKEKAAQRRLVFGVLLSMQCNE